MVSFFWCHEQVNNSKVEYFCFCFLEELRIAKRPFKINWPLAQPIQLDHYSRFEVRLFIIRQSMNFGFWNFLVQIIADYVNFHMTYHTYIWNHAGWHRSVLNMTHFQLFAWFGQTLLVRKMENKSKFLLGDTIGSKFNFKWSSWVWTMSSYQNLRSI